jgi:hypothetical protein
MTISLYCKCGRPHDEHSRMHRGEEVCRECLRAGLGPRYHKYLQSVRDQVKTIRAKEKRPTSPSSCTPVPGAS